MSYFANECFVCKAADTLKICGRCNMISYCGSIHQKFDWPNHKEFCNAISFIMEEIGVSHIYENQLNSDSDSWCKERERMYTLVKSALSRPLHLHEDQMLLIPRSCFVCHETRQECLAACSRCFCVNFCENHPSSPQHDKDCASLKLFHDLDGKIQDPRKLRVVLAMIEEIVINTRFDDSSLIPQSMDEYLDKMITNGDRILIQACASNMLSMSLTLFNALTKLNLQSASELVFHVRCELPDSAVWELLLHFLPNLNFIRIIFVEQPESQKLKMKLCDDCCRKDKKLILQMKDLNYMNFVKDELYSEPDILAYFHVEASQDLQHLEWHDFLEVLSRIGCPMLLTCVTETKAKIVAESLKDTFWTNSICFEGVNEFGALDPIREWTDGGIGKINQYMIVTQDRTDQCKAKCFANDSPLLLKKEEGEFWNHQYFFYPHICRVCRIESALVTCKYCNMVFYCSEIHRREDWYYHKDLCKVIQKLMIDSGRRNIFLGELDLIKTSPKTNSETWLQAKLNVLEKVESLLDRELLVYEQQMFLFPKTCFACHESDLGKLVACRCGIILCKVHKDFRGHKSICRDFYLSCLLSENEEVVYSLPEFRFVSGFLENLADSMQSFLESWIVFVNEDDVTNVTKILIAELLTKPLTLLGAMKKLTNLKSDSIVVHVVGSQNAENASDNFWEVFFFWWKTVNKLSITFLGLEAKHVNLNRDFVIRGEPKNLTLKSYPLSYKQFVLGKFFTKPDIVVGYDLDIHDCDLESCNCIDDILTIKKMNVPFVMTSGTKDRARKDHKRLSEILKVSIAPDFAFLNPFASLEPVRDFKTEGLRYFNKCVIIYSKWAPATNEKKDIFTEQVDSTRSFELEKKLAELVFPKAKHQLTDNLDYKEEEVETDAEVTKKLKEPKEDFTFVEEESKPKISSVFAASSELKNLLRNCGYNSEAGSTKTEIKKKILEEPDLEFIRRTKPSKDLGKSLEMESKINLDKNLEEKCREVFNDLIDNAETENEEKEIVYNGMEVEEITDVEIMKIEEDDMKKEMRNKEVQGLEANSENEVLKETKLQKTSVEEILKDTEMKNEKSATIEISNEANFQIDYKTLEVSNPSVDPKMSTLNKLTESLKEFKILNDESEGKMKSVYKIEQSEDLVKLQAEELEDSVSEIANDLKEKLSKLSEKLLEDTTENRAESKIEIKKLDCNGEIENKSSEQKFITNLEPVPQQQFEYFESKPESTIEKPENLMFSGPEIKFKNVTKTEIKSVESEREITGSKNPFCGTISNANSELKDIMKYFKCDSNSNCETNKKYNILTAPAEHNLKTERDEEVIEKEIVNGVKDEIGNFKPSSEKDTLMEMDKQFESLKFEIVKISKKEETSSMTPVEDSEPNFINTSIDDQNFELEKQTIDDIDLELNTNFENPREIEVSEQDTNLKEELPKLFPVPGKQLEEELENERKETNIDLESGNIETLEIGRNKINENLENIFLEEEKDEQQIDEENPHCNLEVKSEQMIENGIKEDEKRDENSKTPNEAEDSKCNEISKSENILLIEATKSKSELVDGNVGNESSSELGQTKFQISTTKSKSVTQSSATEDSAVDIDLFKEILLLKEEIKRLKENEEMMKSENLRLKEEFNRFQGGS